MLVRVIYELYYHENIRAKIRLCYIHLSLLSVCFHLEHKINIWTLYFKFNQLDLF